LMNAALDLKWLKLDNLGEGLGAGLVPEGIFLLLAFLVSPLHVGELFLPSQLTHALVFCYIAVVQISTPCYSYRPRTAPTVRGFLL
jgi:hypothetical protein